MTSLKDFGHIRDYTERVCAAQGEHLRDMLWHLYCLQSAKIMKAVQPNKPNVQDKAYDQMIKGGFKGSLDDAIAYYERSVEEEIMYLVTEVNKYD